MRLFRPGFRVSALLLPVLLAGALGLSAPVIGGEASLAPQTVAATERCPVCGMYPARYPKWMAQVVFNDYSASSFDSPKELFHFLGTMARYDKKHSAADVGAIYVANYGGSGWLDGKQAWFVLGSKARGPMNDPNLPAFASRAEADAFAKLQGGRAYAYAEITPALLGEDDGDSHAHHHHH